MPERRHVLSMAGIRTGEPCRICGKICNLRELLAVTTKGLGQGAEIEPLQVRFLEVINRMIEVEAVNVAADANHGGLYVAKSPACKAGLSDRTYLPGGIYKLRIGRASDRQGVGALGSRRGTQVNGRFWVI